MSGRPVTAASIAAMISLLDDPQASVARAARDALFNLGDAALVPLRAAAADAQGDQLIQVQRLLAEIGSDSVVGELERLWRGAPDLERGMQLLGRLCDPSGAHAEASAVLDDWAARARDEVAVADDPLRQVGALRRVLVDEIGLAVSVPGSCPVAQALLHGVTDQRRGIPLALCCAWLAVARRLGVPLVGVNMPGHFLLRVDLPAVGASEPEVQLLDAANGGQLVMAAPWRERLRSLGFTDDLRKLDADDRAMLERTLYNLMNLGGAGQRGALTRLMQLAASLRSNDPPQGPSRRPS